MSDIKLTTQQEIAASAKGTSLLVSAAAGSGKTMVLVQRLMRTVCSETEDADITDFLVITYTRAAAAELKERVFRELNRRIAAAPADRKLRRQSVLCTKANISTIHSFCTELLRENAHLIDLTPDFRVADETEASILKAEILERVLDEKYEAIHEDADFQAFVDLMKETRGDKKLAAAVLDAYEKLQSHPDPNGWMHSQEQILTFEGISDLSETIWGREIIDHAKATLDYCINRMSDVLDEMLCIPDLQKQCTSFEVSITCMKNLRNALNTGWDEALAYTDIQFPRTILKNYDYFKNVRQECKEILAKELAVFEGTSEELLDDMKTVAKEARGLYSAIRSFDKEYKLEKHKRGIIDFSDQEHLALKLLYDFENKCPTSLAGEISNRFREVLVDEYQDVNAVQELIFSSISKNGKNLFMVGDVKQSIYRFRMADPTIFLGKYLSFADYDPELNAPRKVILPSNFRSRADILDAVNYVFKGLMSKQFGEMDYTEKEYLSAGAKYPETEESCVEYDILEVDDDSANDLVTAEAEYIASRIREIKNSGMLIPQGDDMRPVEYGDFAILLRSIKGRAWKYAVALDKLGIPVDIPTAEDFFESYEISTMMSLLAVIDNPHQDIPLITTLRSPIFRFSYDELAQLRAENRNGDLYSAVVNCRDTDPKCALFLDKLETFRSLAVEMPADKFIHMIYNSTGITELICASEGGEDRKSNLTILAELARRFESNGFKGLFRFITQLRGMMEKGTQPVNAEAGQGSGVKIMSIHKSKGLEFPVVILADTTHRFNLQDTGKPVLFHSELGIGLYRKNVERKYKYPTVARRAVSRRITLETLSEELRVLYVAMTRAKHKLIMVSTVKEADKEFEKYSTGAEYPAAPTRLETIRNYAGWLMTMLMTRAESYAVYKPQEIFYTNHGETPWDVKRIKYTPSETQEIADNTSIAISPDEAVLEKIKHNMSFEYSYKNSEELPSKVTATELKGRSVDAETMEDAAALYIRKAKLRKPDFTRKDKPLTGSEKGTALHYVMQYIDYSACHSDADISSELTRLVEKHFVSQKQAEAVKPHKILKFFESQLGNRLTASQHVEREFKFSLLVQADTVLNTDSADMLLLQGVIDCYFEEEDGITVIDFKTDRVDSDSLYAKVEVYRTQIKTYVTALERITGKSVKNAYLYFFDMDKAVEII